jgi:hypothetical protein
MERDYDNPVTTLQIIDGPTDLLNDTDRLVPYTSLLIDTSIQSMGQVQIGATNCAGRDAHDGIFRFLDLGEGDIGDNEFSRDGGEDRCPHRLSGGLAIVMIFVILRSVGCHFGDL